MLRQPNKRIGCDLCKRWDVPTYRYDRVTDSYRLWICEGCERKLLEWPSKLIEAFNKYKR